jgi:FkbM family methyltransferase
MRNVFIDCGGHQATSIQFFKRVYPQAEKYVIYSFEANPNFAEFYKPFSDVTYYKAAVWIEDGHILFYSNNGGASSVIEGKARLGGFEEAGIAVPCIDFSNWVKNNCSVDDYIILKMDIEGAEYAVLEKMVDDGTLAYIDKLFIEWHCAKTGGDISIERHLGVLANVVDSGLVPYKWSAAEAMEAARMGDESRLARSELSRLATKGREARMIPPHLRERYDAVQNRVEALLRGIIRDAGGAPIGKSGCRNA